jgi:hypothetical protein
VEGISPKNLTAQLDHRARGNPPGSLAGSSVGNYYPGLELDLRNLWRRIFVGIELHEAVALVVSVEEETPAELRSLLNEILISVDGRPIWIEVRGPRVPQGATEVLGNWSLEWSNALAELVLKGGSKVSCTLTRGEDDTQEVELDVRQVFEEETSLLSSVLAQPGELTQSLCAPWQNDFIGCGCYYWAASRPDYVNVEPDDAGGSRGYNWLQRDRTPATPLEYTLRRNELLEHEDIIRSWEDKLKFVLGGRDES